QTGVLERDHGVADEQRRRLEVLDREAGAVQDERPEVLASGDEGQLELRLVADAHARVHGRAAAPEDLAARGAGGLDRRLDDLPEQLLLVVRGRERLPEPERRLAEPPALGL